ncbi:MAG: carbonic anhydrase family protein [Gammaproteobacteria bacterium]|nr:carbonic anhydrase family protein [Gammaproteobacteria bacterium]
MLCFRASVSTWYKLSVCLLTLAVTACSQGVRESSTEAAVKTQPGIMLAMADDDYAYLGEAPLKDALARPADDLPTLPTVRPIQAQTIAALDNHGWSYAGPTGPEHWADLHPEFSLCRQGLSQSPIDISAIIKPRGTPLDFHYQTSPLHLINDGRNIKVAYNPGSYIVQNGKRFDLSHISFHAPSEHTISGRAADLSADLVHKASDGQLAIISVLFNEGENNEALSAIWEYMPNSPGEHRPSANINALDLLPKKRNYYHYLGSLTQPPCTENVSWNIMASRGSVSAEQVSQYAFLFPNSARPIQPIRNRYVQQY